MARPETFGMILYQHGYLVSNEYQQWYKHENDPDPFFVFDSKEVNYEKIQGYPDCLETEYPHHRVKERRVKRVKE
jgi:hypothetical protein